MTETDTELAQDAEDFGCGSGLDLLKRLGAVPEGIGTGEVSAILGLASHKGIGTRLRTTKSEIRRYGIRFEHAVVRTPRPKGGGSTWRAGPRTDHALHVLRRARKGLERPFDRVREPWPETGYTGPVLVLRGLLHAHELYAVPGGIEEARAIVNDPEQPLLKPNPYRTMVEVFIERIEPGDAGDEIPVPPRDRARAPVASGVPVHAGRRRGRGRVRMKRGT